jgi:2-polyprenyl-3-methyl-5-hydroxy-6-metoxy-1,4-benzoquinol methylase
VLFRSIEAEGNDLNKASIDNLRAMGFNAHLGFSQNLKLDRTYDMVMNLDYLEHSYTPVDDLAMNFKILNPGGVLYLKTLYLGCPNHVANGEAWGLFGNGHFHYFFPETLRKMVESVGFQVAHLQTKGLIVVVGLKPL